MWKKWTLISMSLGTDAARWDAFVILCILLIMMSLGDASGIIWCMSSFAYLGRFVGRIDSRIPLSLTLFQCDLSSKSANLALIQSCSSFTSSYMSIISFTIVVHSSTPFSM